MRDWAGFLSLLFVGAVCLLLGFAAGRTQTGHDECAEWSWTNPWDAFLRGYKAGEYACGCRLPDGGSP